MGSIRRMEYYSATRRGEVLIHVTIWRKLEYIILNARSHMRPHFFMVPFVSVKSDLDSMLVVAWGWEQEGLDNDYCRVQGFFGGRTKCSGIM